MFKVGETAYIDFEVNVRIFTPRRSTLVALTIQRLPWPRLWKAAYTYNDNSTPDNDSVSARINITDKIDNINTYNSDNTVVFEKRLNL